VRDEWLDSDTDEEIRQYTVAIQKVRQDDRIEQARIRFGVGEGT
jgi:hypothetical protein